MPTATTDQPRQQIAEATGFLRQFADADAVVVVISALNRGRDHQGNSSYAWGAWGWRTPARPMNWSTGPTMHTCSASRMLERRTRSN